MVQRNRLICLTLSLFILMVIMGACGPDTIFSQADAGYAGSTCEKWSQPFGTGKNRCSPCRIHAAKGLDDTYSPAYVGLALVEGLRGNVEEGLQLLDQARDLAKKPEEIKAVEEGVLQLEAMGQSKMK